MHRVGVSSQSGEAGFTAVQSTSLEDLEFVDGGALGGVEDAEPYDLGGDGRE